MQRQKEASQALSREEDEQDVDDDSSTPKRQVQSFRMNEEK